MRTFADEFNFQAVRGSSVGVSYSRYSLEPHPKYFASAGWFKNWEYIGIPIKKPTRKRASISETLYFKTGGMK